MTTLPGIKHTATDVASRTQAMLSESELVQAMFDVGYSTPNTAPGGLCSALRGAPVHPGTRPAPRRPDASGHAVRRVG
jgi:hypothetical protein